MTELSTAFTWHGIAVNSKSISLFFKLIFSGELINAYAAIFKAIINRV